VDCCFSERAQKQSNYSCWYKVDIIIISL
jgi:hypothetical protein